METQELFPAPPAIERRTFLIRADSQVEGVCRACRAAITWTWTKRGARMPMNKGFEIADYVPIRIPAPQGDRNNTLLRVYSDQSHFVTCRFALRFKTKASVAKV